MKSDAKDLVVKSEFAGTITVPWEAVTGISAPGPLNVGLSDGQTIVGAVETVGAQVVITTKDAGVIRVTKESVRSLRNTDEQAAYELEIEHFRNPRLLDLWTGYLDLGLAASQGNVNTESLTLSANAIRATNRDKIAVYYTSLFASTDVTGPRTTTANSKRGGVSYDLNLTDRMFVFGLVEMESDQFQSLDLRFAPAGGVGYHAIKNNDTLLDLKFGAAANREFFSDGLNRTSAEVLLGEELTHKFTATTSLNQKLSIFPNFSDAGAYRMNFDLSAVTAIRKWLAWQVTVSDRYLSNPVPGRKKNDALFSTGFRITFAR